MLAGMLTTLSDHRDHYQSRARRRLYLIRTKGEDRVLALRASTLSTVGTWLETADAYVQRGLARTCDPGIDGYAELNAKAAIAALSEVTERAQLVRIRRFESDTKARKTVLAALDAKLESLVPAIVLLPEPSHETAAALDVQLSEAAA